MDSVETRGQTSRAKELACILNKSMVAAKVGRAWAQPRQESWARQLSEQTTVIAEFTFSTGFYPRPDAGRQTSLGKVWCSRWSPLLPLPCPSGWFPRGARLVSPVASLLATQLGEAHTLHKKGRGSGDPSGREVKTAPTKTRPFLIPWPAASVGAPEMVPLQRSSGEGRHHPRTSHVGESNLVFYKYTEKI